MKYFRLATDCFFVEGIKKSAIYDITRKKVYLLNAEVSEIIKELERNHCLDEFNSNDLFRINDFLVNLQRKGLGFFFEKPIFSDKFLLNAPKGPSTPLINQNYFKKVYLNITNECDLNCRFCPTTAKTISWQACLSCVRREDSQKLKKQYDFSIISEQLSSMGIPLLHIRGGNPLLVMDRLLQIVSIIRKTTQTTILITTPGTGQSIDQIVKLIENQKIILNINMMGISPNDSVTCLKNSKLLEQQIELINTLVKKKLPFLLTFLLNGKTRKKRMKFLKFAKEKWGIVPKFAEIYNEDEISKNFRFSHLLFYKKQLFPWESSEAFFQRIQLNNCLSNSFEISFDGKIRMCAGIDRICGEIQESDLKNALKRSDLYELWKKNKNELNQCNECVLRYACLDCSSIEFKVNCDPKMKATFCSYSPNKQINLDEFCWEKHGFISELGMESSRGENA